MSHLSKETDAPLVSVIIPAYNAESSIHATLSSVLAQTYKNIEVLVVDDGSRDRTGGIAEAFVEKDPRVRLIKQGNAGVAAARNRAIEESRGDYVAPLDADDIWHPQKLHKQVDCLQATGPSVGLAYAWVVRIDQDDMVLDLIDIQEREDFGSVEGRVLPALVYANLIGCASVPLIRRACFERVGGYSTSLRARGAQGCEDWDIHLRIAEEYDFRVVREFLVGYRKSRESMSGNAKAMARSYDLIMESLRSRHPEISDDVYRLSASRFAFYLSGVSATGADYASALGFALKALRLDCAQPLVQPRFSTYLLKLPLKLVLSPMVKWLGLDPPTWFRDIKRNLTRPREGMAARHVTEIFDSQAPVDPVRLDPARRYGRVTWRRWLRILEMCQR